MPINKNKLSPLLIETIATQSIQLINKTTFAQKENDPGVSSSNLRNLLSFLNSGSSTPNSFELYLSYQNGRLGVRNREYRAFNEALKSAYQQFLAQYKITDQTLKKTVIRQFIINVIMGGTYLKDNPDKKIKII